MVCSPDHFQHGLGIGGIVYPTAPFNGWYMVTEIGVRNFIDDYLLTITRKSCRCV